MIFAAVIFGLCAPVVIWLSPKDSPRWNRGCLVWQCCALAISAGCGSWWFIPVNAGLVALWMRALRISRAREAAVSRMVHESIRSWDLQ